MRCMIVVPRSHVQEMSADLLLYQIIFPVIPNFLPTEQPHHIIHDERIYRDLLITQTMSTTRSDSADAILEWLDTQPSSDHRRPGSEHSELDRCQCPRHYPQSHRSTSSQPRFRCCWESCNHFNECCRRFDRCQHMGCPCCPKSDVQRCVVQ